MYRIWSGMEHFQKVDSSEMGGMVSRSNPVSVENIIVTCKIAEGRDEKMKTVRRGIPLILNRV